MAEEPEENIVYTEGLWAAAVDAARHYGVNQAALALGLDYNHLVLSSEAMLRLLGQHVEVASKGNMTVFLSSGFAAISNTKAPAQPLPPASIIRVDPGNSGQLLVNIFRIPGARIYEIRYAAVGANGPGPWTTVLAANARQAASVNGLLPGTSYILQVRAYNKAGYSDWSDSVTKICT